MTRKHWIILGVVAAIIIIIIIIIVVVNKNKKKNQSSSTEETKENIAVTPKDAADPDIKEGEQVSVVLDEEEEKTEE